MPRIRIGILSKERKKGERKREHRGIKARYNLKKENKDRDKSRGRARDKEKVERVRRRYKLKKKAERKKDIKDIKE